MASPLCKTAAIAARIAPYSETSCVVTWITRDFGRLATILKGAYRPRSAFHGQFDLLQTCELVFYHGRHHGVAHTARECAQDKPRAGLRTDWRAAAAALYLADLVARLAPPEAPNRALFDFLDRALDGLASTPSADTHLLWLEMKLLDLLGLAPRLTRCASCGCELVPGSQTARLAPELGGLLCGRCADAQGADLRHAPADVLAALQAWQRAALPQAASRTRMGRPQRELMESFLGSFLSHHLELPLQPRAVAFDLQRLCTGTPLPASRI